MKKTIKKITAAFILFTTSMQAQSQTVSTFEALPLNLNSYWNGSSNPMGTTFTDGNSIFPNFYDTSWGGFWASGFAYSNIKDSTTAGTVNMYAARTAEGYNGSNNYVVAQQNAIIKLAGNAVGKVVSGFYVTNSTYAALSMKDGDMFSKKFGGISGNDPDWFKLVVKKYIGGNLDADSVEFYLADYRFSNNTQDYIISTWEWVDLSSLGNADSLLFTLSSSDVGQWGMNTPAFFCIDNITTSDAGLGFTVLNKNLQINIFPNPTTDFIHVSLSELLNCKIEILGVTGNLVLEENVTNNFYKINLSKLNKGVYFLKITNGLNTYTHKIIKQ
jgi:hypothetical protein